MNRKERMESLLRQAFSPSKLEIVDESHSHIGHVGYGASGESHYAILISAQALQGVSRVQAHRLIHQALQPELSGLNPIHALSLKVE